MNLLTTYMGLTLRNPLIASASPLTAQLGTLKALEDHGAAAVVLPSLFEDELRAAQAEIERGDHLAASGSAEAQTYFPAHGEPEVGLQGYLHNVQRAKEALDIPVIASLNCLSTECWREYALQIEQAGADAIELNLGFGPASLDSSGYDVEESCTQIVTTVRSAVRIPIAVKVSPFFSSIGALARTLCTAGASGLVLFNRFYQPDIDIRTLTLSLEIHLSRSWESRLPLLWIALLHGRVPASLGASTGVDTADDVYKFVLAGADVVMTTSALLRHGYAYMRELLNGFETLLNARGLNSPADMRGQMSQVHLNRPERQPRNDYVRMLRAARVASGAGAPYW